MAEDEVVKHTRKIYKVWNSKEHTPWQKAKEFFLEILIIVFAVTLSIWLHDRSEIAHQHKEVKEFLLGLRDDLKSDTAEMKGDTASFKKGSKGFNYIVHVRLKDTVSEDTLKKYYDRLFNTTGLVPNNGRFEGFKSAGKIGTIENKVLQNDIMDLYQEVIPQLLLSTNFYTRQKIELFNFVDMHMKRTSDSTDNLRKIMATDEVVNMSKKLRSVGEILDRYDACIRKMMKIISEIDDEYGKD